MGQLEKYGLYVLCLVIFLILGVALWGEPANAGESTAKVSPAAPRGPAPGLDLEDFKELMSAAPKADAGGGSGGGTAAEPKSEPKSEPKGGGGTPQTEPQPESRRTHTIVAGDTYEAIAKRELGDARFVALLRELNPKVPPEKMQIGKQLVLPTAAELQALRSKADAPKSDDPKGADPVVKAEPKTEPKSEPKGDAKKAAPTGRTHRIERGDTLEGIARQYFGSTKRLEEIRKLNPSVDPTRMRVGQLIKLPD